jgi:hypothetical protein
MIRDLIQDLCAAAALTGFIGAALLIGHGVAGAHEAPTGWEYGRECCDNRDCQLIAPHTVAATNQGWQLTLRPGDHRFARQAQTWTVPFNDRRVKRSGDSDFHACLGPMTGALLCVYVPEMGM